MNQFSTSNKLWLLLKPVFGYLGVVALFWLAFFEFFRFLFLLVNWGKSGGLPGSDVALSFVYGLRFDASITGYLIMLYAVLVALGLFVLPLRKLFKGLTVLNAVLVVPLSGFLMANGFLYSFWGYHFEASALHFLEDPQLVLASLSVFQMVLFPLVLILISWGVIWLFLRLTKRFQQTDYPAVNWPMGILRTLLVLLLGGVMIIPVRGGTGIAPLNTGMAFFSQHLFVNHLALNPVWNFAYSTKRLKATTITYRFMEDEQAQSIFDGLMAQSGDFPKVLKSDRPNIIVVMLESFSAHAIELLGGVNATPNLKALQSESIFFTNVMAASDRSGKGMVAVICGHPVLPSFSIINYPQKTQTLSFVPQELRANGYNDQAFLYGGDLGFNNFNSLVTMAGFNRVITEKDFDPSQMSDKWGAHDGFVFDRLLQEIGTQQQPFFNMFFTLSSHEPFTVPMEQKFEDKYLNSISYTDQCLGDFIREAKKQPWWDNTLLVLIADHGHAGPDKVSVDNKKRFHIPMIWTGGALAVKDTIIDKPATQIDLAATLLAQLNITSGDFKFSKNLFDRQNAGFSFYDFADGFGFIRGNHFQVYDNQARRFIRYEGETIATDTIAGKAILQIMSNDNQQR